GVAPTNRLAAPCQLRVPGATAVAHVGTPDLRGASPRGPSPKRGSHRARTRVSLGKLVSKHLSALPGTHAAGNPESRRLSPRAAGLAAENRFTLAAQRRVCSGERNGGGTRGRSGDRPRRVSEGDKLLTRARVRPKQPAHGTRDRLGVLLLDTAHHHAQVVRFDDDAHALR